MKEREREMAKYPMVHCDVHTNIACISDVREQKCQKKRRQKDEATLHNSQYLSQ